MASHDGSVSVRRDALSAGIYVEVDLVYPGLLRARLDVGQLMHPGAAASLHLQALRVEKEPDPPPIEIAAYNEYLYGWRAWTNPDEPDYVESDQFQELRERFEQIVGLVGGAEGTFEVTQVDGIEGEWLFFAQPYVS